MTTLEKLQESGTKLSKLRREIDMNRWDVAKTREEWHKECVVYEELEAEYAKEIGWVKTK